MYNNCMNNHLASFIKKIRTGKRLNQDEVAKAIKVSRPTYTAIEAGKQNLTIDQATSLAKIFDIGVDSLLSGTIPDLEKYKHMILTFLRMNIWGDGKIPKTKLAKLLYLADFAWFYEHLQSISGMQYRKIDYGPVPDAFFRAIDELEEEGKIVIDRKTYEGKEMSLIKESESNHNQKIETLSLEEKKLMEKIAVKWKDKKTKDIVNFTHNQLPYFLCRDNELIPYELITQEDPDKVY